MSIQPYFSVVIPAYNRGLAIAPTIKSLIEQTYDNFECIVVDDGSNDSDVLQATLSSFDDQRISYIKQKNGGGGAARNTGIIAAKGDFIAFLDSDDLFLKNKLQKMYDFIEIVKSSGKDISKIALYSAMYVDRGVGKMWIRPDRPIQEHEDVGEYLFVSNQFIQTSTLVVKTETARAVMFDPNLRKGQDLDYCVRLSVKGVKFQMLDEPLTVWVDRTEENRTSRHGGYQAPIEWLEKHKSMLSDKAYIGYRATVLAYYTAGEKPVTTLGHIVKGSMRAGVPFKVTVRQLIRCYVPNHLYRKVVNLYVGKKGQ